MLKWGAQSSEVVQILTKTSGLGACKSASTGPPLGGTDPQSWSSSHREWASTRPATGVRGRGKAGQGPRPSGHGQGRGCAYISPLGVAVVPSQAPFPTSPHRDCRGGVGWPLSALQPGPERTPYLGTGSWLMPRCSQGVLPLWIAWHGRRRSGEAAEVLAWPAGPSRTPRPSLAGSLGRAPRRAPRWERMGRLEPPTGEAETVPR